MEALLIVILLNIVLLLKIIKEHVITQQHMERIIKT